MASAGCGSTKVWGCGADVDYTPVGAGNRAPKFWCATKLVAASVLSQTAWDEHDEHQPNDSDLWEVLAW